MPWQQAGCWLIIREPTLLHSHSWEDPRASHFVYLSAFLSRLTLMTLVNWLFLHRIFKLFVIFYPFPAGSGTGSGVNSGCPLITGLVVRSLAPARMLRYDTKPQFCMAWVPRLPAVRTLSSLFRLKLVLVVMHPVLYYISSSNRCMSVYLLYSIIIKLDEIEAYIVKKLRISSLDMKGCLRGFYPRSPQQHWYTVSCNVSVKLVCI